MPLIEFTRRGWIEVYENGRFVSRHTMEREAIERVTNLILEKPQGTQSEYEIRGHSIMAKGYGVLSPGGGDTQAPTTPGSLTGSATSATTIRLTWTQSTDNIGVAGYQIFRNGTPIGTTTSLQYDDTGRTPSTQYSYTVTAYDAAGNNSSAAGPALVTTNANSAPVWSLGNQSYNNGSAVNISLDSVCTDADGDTITYSLVSGSLPTGLALSGARNQTLSGTVTADGSYAFTLGASDGIAAIQNVALTFTVSTPDTTAPNPPSAPTVSAYSSSTITLNLEGLTSALDHASYTIQRSTDGTNYGNRATGITASTWQDTGLSAGTTYYYRLIDVDTSGNASTAGASVSQQTSASSAPYDLTAAGTRTPPFTNYSWPTAPVTTQTINVTAGSYASLLAAIRTAGARVVVPAGTYTGGLSGFASNVDIEMSNSATVAGDVDFGSATRIRWTGGNVSGRAFGGNACTDLLLNNVNITLDGSNTDSYNGSIWNGATYRIAWINTTLTCIDTQVGAWGIFTQDAATHFDWIFANFKVAAYNVPYNANPASLRLQGFTRLIIADSAVHMRSECGTTGLRIYRGTDVWLTDTWLKGTLKLDYSRTAGGFDVSNLTVTRLRRYEEASWYNGIPGTNSGGTGTINNSTLYSTGQSGTPSISPFTGAGNTIVSWNGTTLADVSAIGADH